MTAFFRHNICAVAISDGFQIVIPNLAFFPATTVRRGCNISAVPHNYEMSVAILDIILGTVIGVTDLINAPISSISRNCNISVTGHHIFTAGKCNGMPVSRITYNIGV